MRRRRWLGWALGVGVTLAGGGAALGQGPVVGVRLMPAREVRRLQETGQGPVLVDVRTRGEFLERHITGAISVPLREIEGRASEIPRDGLVVLY